MKAILHYELSSLVSVIDVFFFLVCWLCSSIARPKDRPSSAARQHAVTLQQQMQSGAGAAGRLSPSPILPSHHQHGKKGYSSEVGADSSSAVDSHADTDIPDGTHRHVPPHPSLQRGTSKGADAKVGRGFMAGPKLADLKNLHAPSSSGSGAGPKTPDGGIASLDMTSTDAGHAHTPAPSAGVSVKTRQVSKSPISAKKTAWRASTSKSSTALTANTTAPSSETFSIAVTELFLSVCLPVCVNLFPLQPSAWAVLFFPSLMSVCRSVCLSGFLSGRLFVCQQPACPPFCLPVYLSVCISLGLEIISKRNSTQSHCPHSTDKITEYIPQ